MPNNKKYMSDALKKLNERMPQTEKDRATIASYPKGTGRLHTMGASDDEFSRAVERSYEREHGPAMRHPNESQGEHRAVSSVNEYRTMRRRRVNTKYGK